MTLTGYLSNRTVPETGFYLRVGIFVKAGTASTVTGIMFSKRKIAFLAEEGLTKPIFI